ncbi:MAG: hypothetical protein Q7S61_05670 [bacterium]|nr:hypothetical protein [bacterium]
MDLFTYVIISAVFIMTIYLAVMTKGWFSLHQIIGIFIFGGIIGGIMHTYEGGLVLSIVLTLVFW